MFNWFAKPISVVRNSDYESVLDFWFYPRNSPDDEYESGFFVEKMIYGGKKMVIGNSWWFRPSTKDDECISDFFSD